ncbi:MAG TPA: hypothetical protein VL992_03225 [Tepidisphaeraceae bacterium]|nr:hypothetical protein [Tepidisphaeraceae bacterium]
MAGNAHQIESRLGADYFDRFGSAEISGHMAALQTLSEQNPAALILRQSPDGMIDCTVVAFDHPFEFSLIAGVLAGTGVSIESADAFTLDRVAGAGATRHRRREPAVPAPRNPLAEPVILDHFRGRLLGPLDRFDSWKSAFEPALRQIIGLLDRDDDESVEKAKRLVNTRVTQWLTDRRAAHPASVEARRVLPPVDMRIEQLPTRTRLHLAATDTPAFLYALSTALSLHKLSIKKVCIRTPGGKAVDEIDFTDAKGRPLSDAAQLDGVKLSVLLTQQFAYFLDRAPDPFTALTRFETLAEQIIAAPDRRAWLDLLANPNTMTDLARVLGASDWLWEEFIRRYIDSLLPIIRPHVEGREFCLPSSSLPRRLEAALAAGANLQEKRRQLNEFKDRELFFIDLDHILSSEDPDARFGLLSSRLVTLAENLVSQAARLVHADLVRRYGNPLDDDGAPLSYAVFGLGKLGGMALGYASDIELLFAYGAAAPTGAFGIGRTEGGANDSIAATEFFEHFVQETSAFIQSKREGIFRVDLRLRPFGRDGPLACSIQQFREYYRPGGHAHPFESMATICLRWIAGDRKLGLEIEQMRNEFLYEGPMLDLDAIWDVWGKMRARHVSGRQLNSKYSVGALRDLETSVQLLQIKLARNSPQLRTPRLPEAIQRLYRASAISAAEFQQLTEAYHFFRRLMNAQRMLRGSADDLVLPPSGSDELIYLARRMDFAIGLGAEGAEALLEGFVRHAAAVAEFIVRQFARVAPGAEGPASRRQRLC